MIKITLPTSETLPESQFFTKITQASTRGDFIVYNDDYTQATLELSTDAFFTIEDAKNIVNAGGEVEGYGFWLEFDKSRYENESIPVELYNILFPTTSETEDTTTVNIPTWKQVFHFVTEIVDEPNKVKFLTSFQSEFLIASIVVKYILPFINN